jgi:hypothetical protein
VTFVVPFEASAFMLSFFMVSCAEAMPKVRIAIAKQIAINFFICFSP